MINFLKAENIVQNVQRFESEECENGNDCYLSVTEDWQYYQKWQLLLNIPKKGIRKSYDLFRKLGGSRRQEMRLTVSDKTFFFGFLKTSSENKQYKILRKFSLHQSQWPLLY